MLDSLGPEEEQNLLKAVEEGKPLFVLHAASASFRQPPPDNKVIPIANHPEFYAMIGGYVARHPPMAPYKVQVTGLKHPITRDLGIEKQQGAVSISVAAPK